MKRKCGTCVFFEDRGVAGSGICQHIKRRELRDVVLVRQTELACRNTWDQDLWVESPNPVLNPALTGIESEERDVVFDSRPSSLTARNNSIDVNNNDLEEPGIGGTEPPVRSRLHRPASLRTGIIRPFHGANSDEIDDDTTEALRRTSVNEARKRIDEERRRTRQKEQESHFTEIDRRMTSPDAIGDRHRAWNPVPTSGVEQRPILVAGLDEFPNPPANSPSEDRSRLTATAVEQMRGASGTSSERHQVVPTRNTTQETEQLPTDLVRSSMAHATDVQSRFSRTAHPTAPVAVPLEPFVHIDGNVPRSAHGRDVDVPVSALGVPELDDPIERVERLALLQRCCATCRDFRQVGDGERGQCVNVYAFGDRRMVKSDQLACRSSLGTWWMPNDDVWLERADTSHHGRSTPLLDAAIRAQRSGADGRDSHA